MNTWLILPVLVPFAAAAVSILFWNRIVIQRGCGLAGAAGMLIAAIRLVLAVLDKGILELHIGGWPPPFGINLVADRLGAVFVLLSALSGVAVVVYSFFSVDPRRETMGYYSLLNFLLGGLGAAFLTGDLFNLYVWIELTLLSSFALMVIGSEIRQLEGTLKYLLLNIIASFLLLAAIGIVYGLTGTLNMADAARLMRELDMQGFQLAVSALFIAALGIKAAAFPFHFWLPASYSAAPIAVSAMFVGIMTKIGIYALIRVFTLIFPENPAFTHNALLVIAMLTMISGALGALAQTDIRKLLSFHLVEQMGFLLMGLGLFSTAGLAAAIFLVFHLSLAEAAMFLIAGIVYRVRGTYDLRRIRGLYADHPWIAGLFFLPAMALAGLPPLSGFFAKYAIIKAGIDGGSHLAVAVAVAVTFLSLFYIFRLWTDAFWGQGMAAPGEGERHPGAGAVTGERRGAVSPLVYPSLFLAALTLVLGAAAGPVYNYTDNAAEQLMSPGVYIDTVLGAAE